MSYINPYVYFLYIHAGTMPPPGPAQNDYQGLYGIQQGATTARLPHTLQTASVVPAFTPSWNTGVWPTAITSTYVDVKFSVPAPRAASLDFSVSRGTPQAVSAGALTATVSHNLGTDGVLLFAANWNTVIKLVSKAASSAVVSFSVQAPASGAYLYYGSHADSADIADTETVSSGSSTHTIEHGASRAFLPIFVTPYWNTSVTWVNKSDLNQTVLKFGTPPNGSESLDYRVKAVGNVVVS